MMKAVVVALRSFLVSLFRSRMSMQVEILALRYRLAVGRASIVGEETQDRAGGSDLLDMELGGLDGSRKRISVLPRKPVADPILQALTSKALTLSCNAISAHYGCLIVRYALSFREGQARVFFDISVNLDQEAGCMTNEILRKEATDRKLETAVFIG